MKRSYVICICLLMIFTGIRAQNKYIPPDLKKYNLSINTGLFEPVIVDTLISNSQIFHPLYKKFPGWAELGNMGLPAIPLYYSGVGQTNSPAYLQPYSYYLSDNDKVGFYNTKSPFSQISFAAEAMGDKNKVGQLIDFIYTRNFGRGVNITGFFDFVSSDGLYAHQAATESLMGLNLSVEKHRYKHYASIERILFKLEENGGVENDSAAISSQSSYTAYVDVNLNDATSKTSIIRIKGFQSFDLYKSTMRDTVDSVYVEKKIDKFKPALIHRYNYTSAKRLYNDLVNSLDFYPDTLFSGSLTKDSVQHHDFINDVGLRINGTSPDSTSWFVEAGLHHELLHLYSYYGSDWEQGLGLSASVAYSIKNIALSGQGRFMFAGYQAGDHKLIVKAKYLRPGEIRGPEISLSSKAYTPDLFISSYMGNHYQWKNVFSKQIEQKVGLSWDLKKWNLFFDVNFNLISNWIFFNYDAKPEQRDKSGFLVSSSLTKVFEAGPFRSRNSVFINYTNAEEIPLPLLVASSSTFMHHDIHFHKTNGLLQIEYGFDLRFVSGYNGFAYMPATGVFYLQNEQVLGNYPVLDLFFVARVKRTRFFVKWDHVNYGFTGDNIFPVLHYPLKQRNVKYGVYWHFHD